MKKFRCKLALDSAEFGLVQDVANATKHARLDGPAARVKDVSDVRSAPNFATWNGQPVTWNGERATWGTSVVVVVDENPAGHLIEVIPDALAFLCERMDRLFAPLPETETETADYVALTKPLPEN